jgi:antitoxin component of RelBE/YafQ-DinJ toxin-antitoxin module
MEQWQTMANATIRIDTALKARLAGLASQTGQSVDEFVEATLRRIADADICFDRGVPVFPRRVNAPMLSVEDVDRLVHGHTESK